MGKKNSIIATIILLVLFIIGGIGSYLLYFNKRAQIDRAIKPDTSIDRVSNKEQQNPRIKIVENGYNVEVTISPSINNTISGKVNLTAVGASSEAAGVGFFITDDEQGYMKEGLPNIGMDQTASDGWSSTLDTTAYENGEYFINVIVFPEGGEGNPLGIAQIPVEIKN